MSDLPWLTAAACAALVFGPLLTGLLVYLLQRPRLQDAVSVILAAGLLACLALLSRQVLVHGAADLALGAHEAPVGIELHVDGLALAMLWLTGAVALAVNVHAAASLPAGEGFRGTGFRTLWMLLWSGLNALFLSADLFNIYVVLELVSLTAVSLVVISQGAGAVAAAARYLFFALGGSIFYLLGVALVYADTGLLGLRVLEASNWEGRAAPLALAVMTAGLAVKAALFPVHAWLPRAHSAAPSAASAALSALVATAGVYLILRLWLGPFAGHWGPVTAQGMAAVGAAGMLYGSAQALRQSRLKLVVAYSTVAQLGYLLLALPLASALAFHGAVYHALSHGLAKAAFFLAAGNVIRVTGDDRLESLAHGGRKLFGSLAAMALAGMSLAGLPPSGGFLAKWWLISAALAAGQWWWAAIVAAGGLLAAAYVGRVLRYGMTEPERPAGDARAATPGPLPRAMSWPPVLLAVAAIVLGFAGSALMPWLETGMPGGLGE